MANGEVIIDVNADTSKYEDKVKGLGGKTESMMKKAEGASFGLLGAVTAAAAGVAVVGATSVGAAEEAAAANKRLDQIYSQMGDSTGKLSQAAKDYADELSKQIGVDDEVIKAGQAKLATFSKVSSSATTMARATKAAADLSAAGFGDISSTSVQLGKALQDPIKGMTALSRSGVTFTEQEKETIKAMYEAGDVAGYQEIMFKAVEKQVGGVSEATATMGDKMGVYLGEIQESLGQAFLPIAEAILPLIEDLSTKIGEFFEGDWQGKLKELAPIITVLGGAIMGALVPALWGMAKAAGAALFNLAPFLLIGALIGGAIYLIVDALGGWENAWKLVTDAFTAMWEFMQPIVANIQSFLTSVFADVQATVVSLVDGIVEALGGWSNIWQTISDKFTEIWAFLSPLIQDAMDFISTTVKSIRKAIDDNMGLIQETVRVVMGVISKIWDTAWGIIKAVVPPIFNAIKDAISGALKLVGGILKAAMQIITGDWGGAWDTIKQTLSNLVGSLGKIAGNIGKAIWDGLKAALSGIGDFLLDILKGAAEGAFNAFKKVFGIKSPAKKMKWAVQMIGKGMEKGLPSIDKAVGKLNSVMPTMMPASLAGLGTMGASGSVVNYTQNIYTPVTSYGETKRAQREMGMTLAGRLV